MKIKTDYLIFPSDARPDAMMLCHETTRGKILQMECADFADLDGPLWLANDREHGICFDGGLVHAPARELWG